MSSQSACEGLNSWVALTASAGTTDSSQHPLLAYGNISKYNVANLKLQSRLSNLALQGQDTLKELM